MLEVRRAVLLVGTHQLARVLHLGRYVAVEELDEAQRLVLAHEVEVHAVAEGLRQKEKRSVMVHAEAFYSVNKSQAKEQN